MTSHGICTECAHPLLDGEYFVLTGEAEGIHHECPEEIVTGDFDRDPQEPSTTMSHPTYCPICSDCIADSDETAIVGDDLCHAHCVGEVNNDLDAMETDGEDSFIDDAMDGDHESALASAGFGTDEDYGGYGDDGGDW